jgi:glycosyltransferase involved in cell wall biosynthesis
MSDKILTADFHFSFLGNPYLDSRVMNFAETLREKGKSVAVTGFDWYGKIPENRRENFSVFEIERRPAIKFYYRFAKILRTALEKTNAKIYVAEDVYTLPLVVKAAKKRNAKVYYDSRELYNYIGGLTKKPLAQKIIAKIEKKHIYSVDKIIVTGEMDKDFLADYYKLPNEKFIIIRNMPKIRGKVAPIDLREKFGIPENAKILIYQGVLSAGRGIAKVIKALSDLPNTVFVIIGDGPERRNFEILTEKLNLEKRVIFTGAVPNEELLSYTAGADIGVALIENISVSYYYALPNKLFEYVAAGLPVVVSPLPQMKKIVERYKIGVTANPESEREIHEAILKLTSDEKFYSEIKANTTEAAKELNWDTEFLKAEKSFLLGE